MLAHINGFAQKPDTFGFEAFPHDVGGLEVHLPRELAEAIHHAMAGDIDPVAMRYGVQGPPDEPCAPTGSNCCCDVPIGGHRTMRDSTYDVVNAVVDVGGHAAR